jgi:hypothetical protein
MLCARQRLVSPIPLIDAATGTSRASMKQHPKQSNHENERALRI